MRKVNGYMIPIGRKRRCGKVKCKRCGKQLTPAEACYYVDGCNCAITANAPAYCLDCYLIATELRLTAR